MPILGFNYNERAVPKKPAVYKPTPIVTKPKAVYKPTPIAKATTYQPVSASVAQAAPVVAQPNMADITKQYLDESNTKVNGIYDNQKNAQLEQLKAQRESALGKVNQQKSATQQSYYDQRNQADVVSAQNVQRLKEIMASNGISASGENLTFNAQANSDRMNSLNTLNNQEQAQMNEYSNQINDINNPAQEQSILSQIESERSKALLEAQNTAQEKAWRQYTFNNMSASEKATLEWAKTQYGEDAAWRMFEMNYNGELQKSTNQAQISAALGFDTGKGGGGTAQFQSDMSKAVQRGVDASWVPLLSEIVKRESSYNPNAKNPTSSAYGYGQFLSSTRANYEKKTGLSYSDPVNQLIMMSQYVKDRYGTPEKALAFWNKNHWY